MCTKADFAQPWILNSSLTRMGAPALLHRKMWELSYIVYVVEELNLCRNGTRGLVFAAGFILILIYLCFLTLLPNTFFLASSYYSVFAGNVLYLFFFPSHSYFS